MHARPLKILGLIAPMFAMGAGGAYTGALTTADIFSQFNAVIFGNFSTSSDVEGRTIVGGNLTGGATFDLNPVGAAASAYSALSVYGSATSAGSYNVNNAGGIAIAGSNAASFNLNGGGSAYVGGANSGSLTLQNGIGSLAVVGSNSGTLQLGSGGTVYVGGTTGGINTTGSATVSINGNNTANLNINGGGTVSLNGSNLGTVSLNGGSLAYTGSQSGNLNLNGGATATKVASLALSAPTSTLGSFATTFQAPLTALSTQLNTLAVTSAATSANGAITFNATPNSSGVAVFDVNTSLFAANSTVNVKLGGATSVIVNVNVDSCVSSNCSFSLPNSVNFANPTGYAAAVLWNFVNATSLTFTNEFGGTVLAPLAAVSNNGPIDGTLVAASFSGNGELHSHPYSGTLTTGASLAVPAPEPASVALLVSGLAALATIRRRRNARNRRAGRQTSRLRRCSTASSTPAVR